ncbi:hypothetical protein AC1031_002960 [Aphanomyces cochlioides]|nr:hypothetical protein AC1031_002960 [Aphanomyces cochlioides]
MAETPLTRINSLIIASNRALQPTSLRALTIDEILVQRSDLPPLNADALRANGFESVVKYVQAYDQAAFDESEMGKWTATRYMALRSMLAECDRAKKTALHQDCVCKVLQWFDASGSEYQQAAVATTLASVSPVKSPKPRSPDGHNNTPPRTPENVQRFKQRDLRTSHIHRIAELRERGFTIASPRELPVEDERLATENNQEESGGAEGTRSKAGFQYHTPETDAEHELNQLWLHQRQEEASAKAKHAEVDSAVLKWSRNRSRDEGEFLRKQESTRMMAHKQHPNMPLHVSTAKETNQADDLFSFDGGSSDPALTKPRTPGGGGAVIVKKKPSATGMRFRNPLPPNYRPSTSASVDVASPLASNLKSPIYNAQDGGPLRSFASSHSSVALSDTPDREALQTLKESTTAKANPLTTSYTSLLAPDAKQLQLQRLTEKRKAKKLDAHGALGLSETVSDPELKLFFNAAVERRCQVAARVAEHRSGNQPPIWQPKLLHSTSFNEAKRSNPHALAPGTSSLRMHQMDELDEIRDAFERHHLSFNSAVFERALLIPEDKSAAECSKHLPIAGSKLPENPLLATKSKLTKGLVKKKAKKGKKGKKLKKKKKAK